MKNNYEKEVRERYGNTEAYREHTEKTKNYTKEKWTEAGEGLLAVFAEFAALKHSGAGAESAEAQALVKKLQTHITENYYTCTDDILAGLGKMYVADERFKKNIDKYGDGTAEFVAEAITAGKCVWNMIYCTYLDRNVDAGLCHDLQMISSGYISVSALPDINIDKLRALKTCEKCKHKMDEVET